MEFGHRREIVKPDEGMIGDNDRRECPLHLVIGLQLFLGVVDELKRIRGRHQGEKEVLGDD